ncbi:MAG: dockerin type I repeat-containing protein, partial [Dehalococcoidia bacterium]
QGSFSVTLQAQAPTTGLAAWNIDVTFDRSVLAITGCSFPPGDGCNPVSGPGAARVMGSAGPPLTGTQILATLSFRATGAVGSSSPLVVTVNSLIDGNSSAVRPVISGGIVTLRARGDVNGDMQVTAVDALCILRSVAALAMTTNCPNTPSRPDDPVWDVNGDGRVDAVDALCILRAVAALPGTVTCAAFPIQPSSSAGTGGH